MSGVLEIGPNRAVLGLFRLLLAVHEQPWHMMVPFNGRLPDDRHGLFKTPPRCAGATRPFVALGCPSTGLTGSTSTLCSSCRCLRTSLEFHHLHRSADPFLVVLDGLSANRLAESPGATRGRALGATPLRGTRGCQPRLDTSTLHLPRVATPMRLFVRFRLSYPALAGSRLDRVGQPSRDLYSSNLPRFYLPGATRIVGIQRFPI